MSVIERQGEDKEHRVDPVEILARYEAGIIREQQLSDEESFNLHLAKGIMLDDPAFEAKVRKRQAELEEESKSAQIDPQIIERNNLVEIAAQMNVGRIKRADLKDEIKDKVDALRKETGENPDLEKQIIDRQNEILLMPVKKSEKKRRFVKKSKGKDDPYIQPSLPIFESDETIEISHIDRSDIEIKMDKMGKLVNSRLGGGRDKEIRKEVSHRKSELRKMINLPVVRKGSGHETDNFYKFLVRRIITWDMFSVFKDYCSATTGVPEELKLRIENVKETVDILTSKESGLTQNEKFRYFDKALLEYRERWGLD